MPQGRGPVAPGIPVPGAEAAVPPVGEKPLRRDAERNRQRILTAAIDLRVPISQYPRKTPGER